ncbi:MAG: Gfo/Idh/MocA family oxidoreductase [Pseudomonadota bacterium]
MAFANPVVERLGRRIRLGVIGGGTRALIGHVHRSAARLDDYYTVEAGVVASDPDRARAEGVAVGLQADRAYGTLEKMLDGEAVRADGIDAVAVMTPNHRHHPDCAAALARGLHVICDKPLTTSLADARDLARLVKEAGVIFAFTHNYSGFSMVRQARAMVAAGDVGEVRQVGVEYLQGQLSTYVEPSAPERLKWRLDPARGGPSPVLGDIGTHAYQLASFVTGMPVTRLAADVGPTVPKRTADDYAAMLLRFENGARGSLWVTQAASGAENALKIRVYGSKGGLEWSLSEPDRLRHMAQGQPARLLSSGLPNLSPQAQRAARMPPGHPQGFFEAFANIYRDAAEAIAGRLADADVDPLALDFPTVEDGVLGMAFLEAAIRSARDGGRWVDCPL